jgi:hypothetical protein
MSSRGQRIPVAVMVTALALTGIIIAGCSMDRWARVAPGEYAVLNDWAAANSAAARVIQRLDIDREPGMLVLTRVDGSKIITSFVPRDKTEWPSGCPTNVYSTRMEVLDIEEDSLTIGATAFSHPILVRDCPPDPTRIVLREDGAIGGSGSACPHLEPCIFFAPRSTTSQIPMLLPHSPKGYELYSWQAGVDWHFTLITGTNRLKVYKEIVATDSLVTDTDWVKLSVGGTENLKAVLSRLPKGETVTWNSGEWLDRVGTPEGKIRLPGRKVINEIDSHCHRLGIQLRVAE